MSRLDAVDRKVLDDIARVGWSAIGVFPTQDDPGPYFTYTVGMVEQNHPDLIVTGMPMETAHGVLASAYEAIQRGNGLTPDTYADEVLQGLPVAVVEVLDPLGDMCPMSMCQHLFGEVHGLQLVWPDAKGKFHWHPGFDEKYRDQQPLLGIWRGP